MPWAGGGVYKIFEGSVRTQGAMGAPPSLMDNDEIPDCTVCRVADGGVLVKNFWFIAALLFAPYAAAQVSSGTAFSVAPGLLVTNQHVVDGCASVEVVASDGRRTGAVVDADALIDLALIRVTGLKGATARLRSPRNVRLGEAVMVFGFPLSGSLSSGGNFTSGNVSALRGLRDAAGEIQITAPVQPGNSGGPVMD